MERRASDRAVLYPDQYCWFVLVGTLDLIFTFAIVWAMGGREANPIAAHAINVAGFPGLIGYKFALTVLVVVVCEQVGQRRAATGKRLSEWAVAISAIPAAIGLATIGQALLGETLLR